MKQYVLTTIIAAIAASTSLASSFVCSEIGNQSKKRAVILTQIEGEALKAYSSARFELKLTDASKNDDALHILLRKAGTLSVGDVDMDFSSDDGLVTFSTYLDEQNSGRLNIKGSASLILNCKLR